MRNYLYEQESIVARIEKSEELVSLHPVIKEEFNLMLSRNEQIIRLFSTLNSMQTELDLVKTELSKLQKTAVLPSSGSTAVGDKRCLQLSD